MPRINLEEVRSRNLRADQQTKEIDVPELGGTVLVRGITLAERNRARENAVTNTDTNDMDMARFQTYVLLEGCVEPRLDISDLGMIGEWPAGVCDRLVTAIYELSGMAVGSKKNGSTPTLATS